MVSIPLAYLFISELSSTEMWTDMIKPKTREHIQYLLRVIKCEFCNFGSGGGVGSGDGPGVAGEAVRLVAEHPVAGGRGRGPVSRGQRAEAAARRLRAHGQQRGEPPHEAGGLRGRVHGEGGGLPRHLGLELEMKVHPHEGSRSRGLLRICEIFANLRLTFV